MEYFITDQKEFDLTTSKDLFCCYESQSLYFHNIDEIIISPLRLTKKNLVHIDFYSKYISFKQAGTGESYSIYTLRHWTTVQGETSVPGYPFQYWEWTAYFDGTHDSPDAFYYYIDIDDDKLVQGNYLEFKLQLWRINRHWDNKHLSGYDIYSINDVGHSEIVNITSIEEFESVQMKTEAKINVTTIGVEKANTIAIYETNGTVFNGHYQEQERMNIIQLYVNDSGAGTPFVEGPNVIVIPTSLFTEIIFNAYVQNETLHETPIYSSDEDTFKFISMGRDGDTQQACDEIDFVFIRFNISSEDAMEILNLLLECLINETTNETAFVYSYISTKLNGTSAVMMNLPIPVLGIIPWFCAMESSSFGKTPKTSKQAFWEPLKKVVSFAVGLIITIGMAILELVELIAEFVMDILMEWLPILEYILWLIIRVLILILVWIIFAITLLIVIIEFVSIVGVLYTISLFRDVQITTKIDNIKAEGDLNIEFGYDIGSKYIDFLEFYIPTIETYFEADNLSMVFKLNFFSVYINFEKFPEDVCDQVLNNDPIQSSGLYPKSSSSSDDELIYILEIISNIGDGTGHCGAVFTITAFVSHINEADKSGFTGFYAGLIVAIFEIVSFIIITFTYEQDIKIIASALLGLGIGYLFSGVIAIASAIYMHLIGTVIFNSNVDTLLFLFQIDDALLTVFGIVVAIGELVKGLPDDEIWWLTEESITSITGGFFGLTVGIMSMMTVANKGIVGMEGLFFIFVGLALIITSISMVSD
ncbi:MAG: hypothetical protein ACFFAQ_01930 [Promethearchaeota archaeon]